MPIFDARGASDLVPSDDAIYMRGFSGSQFTTAIDGMPLRKTGGHQSTHIVDYGQLPPWLFETIEVKPGPHFADYPGKSIGGVLNLISRAPQQYDSLRPEVTVNLDYGSYDTHNDSADINGGVGKFIYDFGYQYYHTDGYLRHTESDIKTARWNYPLEDHKRFEALSGFIQDNWTIAPGLNLLMGLRYEDVNIWVSNFSLLNQTFITGRERWIERKWNQLLPKSFLTWELDSLADGLRDTSVSLGVSKVWHAPDYHGDYNCASVPTGAWLDPEHGMGYDLVFSRRIAGDLNLKINYAYYVETAGDERNFFYWELGVKADPVDWLSFRYAYSEQEEEIQGIWVDEGDGIRKIHEAELNLFPMAHLELFTSFTYHDTEYTKGPNAGNELRCIPGHIWKLGLEYALPWKTTELRMWYTDADAWYTDPSNDHAYEGYQTLDLKVIQHIGEKWTLALDVKNLTDETYSEFVSFWSGENQYAGSTPRAFYLTLKYDLM